MAGYEEPVAAAPASEGFPPVVDGRASVLILGSLPGRRSIAEQQYYAHPRNAFWRILGQLLGFEADNGYPQRCRELRDRGVALWDVLASSVRPGSLDSAIDIASAKPNDFAALLARHGGIRTICFNGAKAGSLFRRLVLPELAAATDLRLLDLPSTSPAHAAMPYAEKFRRWSVIRTGLTSV